MRKVIITVLTLIFILELAIIIKPDFFREKLNIVNNNQNTEQPNEQNQVQSEEQNLAQTTDENGNIKVVDYIETDNYANKSLKFFYFIPKSLLESSEPYPLIVWVPGLDSDGEETLPWEFYEFAENNGFAILTPSFRFDEENLNKMMSYQFPAVWSGKAFMDILDKSKKDLNFSKLYLVGFSAGAQFVSRFSLLQPDMVDACAILSSGGDVKPTENVKNVKYFYGVGLKDDKFRINNADNFTKEAKKLGINVELKKYDFDHSMDEKEVADIMNFFKRVKDSK